MNKLKLRLDDLHIDSFDTTAPQKEKGTVLGEQCTCYTQCTCPGCPSCAHYATCDASCNGTCGGSCNGTCGATCNASCYGTCDCGSNDSCYDTCAGSCATCQFSCDDMYTCVGGVYGMVC